MTEREGLWVMAIKLKDSRECQLLDWNSAPFSKRDLRRSYKKFRGDGDVASVENMRMEKFFGTKQEMIKYFRSEA